MFEIMGRKYASVTCADVVLYDLVLWKSCC